MRNIIFDQAPDLPILYQDEHIVAINKPSGLLVHRSEIDKRETLFALQLTRDLVGQHVYPVHRLDRPTSGVLLFALSSEVASLLSTMFAQHDVQKTYLAMVRGFVNLKPTDLSVGKKLNSQNHESDIIIDYPLKRIFDKLSDKDRNQDAEAQDATTYLKRLATAELEFPTGRYAKTRYSLVELAPKTGRKHQLRRHMAHIRHPIIGDTNHGDGKQNQSARDNLSLNRLALHAHKISFLHPVTMQHIEIKAPIDDSLKSVFERCKWTQI
jgi:tRNA pseudouridine65 synthase